MYTMHPVIFLLGVSLAMVPSTLLLSGVTLYCIFTYEVWGLGTIYMKEYMVCVCMGLSYLMQYSTFLLHSFNYMISICFSVI